MLNLPKANRFERCLFSAIKLCKANHTAAFGPDLAPIPPVRPRTLTPLRKIYRYVTQARIEEISATWTQHDRNAAILEHEDEEGDISPSKKGRAGGQCKEAELQVQEVGMAEVPTVEDYDSNGLDKGTADGHTGTSAVAMRESPFKLDILSMAWLGSIGSSYAWRRTTFIRTLEIAMVHSTGLASPPTLNIPMLRTLPPLSRVALVQYGVRSMISVESRLSEGQWLAYPRAKLYRTHRSHQDAHRYGFCHRMLVLSPTDRDLTEHACGGLCGTSWPR
ncbi:uncharacterized protein ARMOST_22437 [Armillaria ostoyae]|uniref:Uncharacterized protein n=1 Tax=Armillaria ostoyae TaxID=47428 RepID=A0A284SCV6_ARMOS|nr:uncharacterized protein ARMOST_22437 [Armillaria ostoyae]